MVIFDLRSGDVIKEREKVFGDKGRLDFGTRS